MKFIKEQKISHEIYHNKKVIIKSKKFHMKFIKDQKISHEIYKRAKNFT